MKALYWFRRDLRIADNRALSQACQLASEGLIAVFIITPATWQRHDRAACQVDFMLQNLAELSAKLEQYNIPLLIKRTNAYQDCSQLVSKLMQQYHCDTLFFNREYEQDELQRDQQVEAKLAKEGLQVKTYHDQTILPPDLVLTQEGSPYQVFTPFSKTWLKQAEQTAPYLPCKPIKKQQQLNMSSDRLPCSIKDFQHSVDLSNWKKGERAAQQALKRFIKNGVEDYHQERDFPALPGTSQLSPYLALGVLSPRQCIMAMLEALETTAINQLLSRPGMKAWLNELIWRDFYKAVVFHFPHVSQGRAFKRQTDQLAWIEDDQLFQAWCDGQTGIPLIDAAMRCLKQTGWLHNRLRMVVAMFLTKNLLIDWRRGEAWFMQHLLDGDFAANNGGWQWSASTGTDAAPYFRVFNPIRQSERFDPQGEFIKRYCPELKSLDAKMVHEPFAKQANNELDYPKPIVNLKTSRVAAIKAFKQLKE